MVFVITLISIDISIDIIIVLLITGRGIPWGAVETMTRKKWKMIKVVVLLLILPAILLKGTEREGRSFSGNGKPTGRWNQILTAVQ